MPSHENLETKDQFDSGITFRLQFQFDMEYSDTVS